MQQNVVGESKNMKHVNSKNRKKINFWGSDLIDDRLIKKKKKIDSTIKSEITMATEVGTSKKCEQRAVIKFPNPEGVCGNEIHECVCNMYNEGAVILNRAFASGSYYSTWEEWKYTTKNIPVTHQIQ